MIQQRPILQATDEGYRASNYEGLQMATDEMGLHPVEPGYQPAPLVAEKLGSTPTVSQSQYSVISPFSAATAQPAITTTAGAGVAALSAGAGQIHPDLDPYEAQYGAARSLGYDDSAKPPSLPPTGTSTSGGGRDARILGLRRTTFFLTLSNIAFAIGLILVGVLVSRDRNNSSSSSTCASGATAASGESSGTATSSVPIATGTVSPSAVCFATTSIASGTRLGTPIVDCPRTQNLTRYIVPNTGLTFERACSIDYRGNDLGRFPVVSMLDCLHLCAQLNLYPSSAIGKCMGVTWVFGDGLQGLGVSYCYPKTNVTDGVVFRGDAESAALVNT